ncbi:MAG TPA: 30S ribosomal protein S19e [Euryarchaeota archaeon]|nr:30S ribosomal protein S19e [archaeon BMS3Bbin15]HDL15650.1 30S ribosomal protein S19e [Euryarchaeota archaeon]
MATVYDIPQSDLIMELSKELKKIKEIKQPVWADFVKTGAHKEKSPTQKGWWYIRSASLLRKLYIHGPVGIPTLKRWYGGRKNRGYKPDGVRRGSGAVIKNILNQLEKAGFVDKTEKGRKISSKGVSFIDSISSKIIKKHPELEIYR